MSNSISKTRTNFVGITDFDKFKDILSRCVVDDGEMLTIIENTEDGITKYGFYVEENICGMRERDAFCNAESCADCEDAHECDVDCNYDDFLKELQQVIVPGDALIITTFCYEKMCYLLAYVDIITCDAIEAITLESEAFDKAREMLGNKDWTTTNSYGNGKEIELFD